MYTYLQGSDYNTYLHEKTNQSYFVSRSRFGSSSPLTNVRCGCAPRPAHGSQSIPETHGGTIETFGARGGARTSRLLLRLDSSDVLGANSGDHTSPVPELKVRPRIPRGTAPYPDPASTLAPLRKRGVPEVVGRDRVRGIELGGVWGCCTSLPLRDVLRDVLRCGEGAASKACGGDSLREGKINHHCLRQSTMNLSWRRGQGEDIGFWVALCCLATVSLLCSARSHVVMFTC